MSSDPKVHSAGRGVSRRGLLAGSLLPATAGRAFAVEPQAEPPGVVLPPYLTEQSRFRDVSRGSPIPHTLTEERRREVGLTRETWRLEVVSDPDQPSKLGRELTRAAGSALDFAGLMALAEKHAVRFPKVMTCLNIGRPLGMGIWEGVPLRNVVWLTAPSANLRRVFYHGFHNAVPAQLFQSSLPIGRVLEDYYELPPVILCYKLNGEWLDPRRGGPVRMLVPEAYGFKSVKWLTRVILSNGPHSNDTYAGGNNDIDSPLKTFAGTFPFPRELAPGATLPVGGYAQVGISGLSRVQTWVSRADAGWPADDPHFTRAPWTDARLLPAPAEWGGELPGGRIPAGTIGFDEMGRPRGWPLRLAMAHWSAVLPGLTPGRYVLRVRTIDATGNAQPMPRPFQKSGHAAIEETAFTVKA